MAKVTSALNEEYFSFDNKNESQESFKNDIALEDSKCFDGDITENLIFIDESISTVSKNIISEKVKKKLVKRYAIDAIAVKQIDGKFKSLLMEENFGKLKPTTNSMDIQIDGFSMKTIDFDDKNPLNKQFSEYLEKINIEFGDYKIRYSIQDGNKIIEFTACLFVYNYEVKFVISDIDGTLTKSDIGGHFFSQIGYRFEIKLFNLWAQRNVVSCFSKIAQNGYKVIYISSRSRNMIPSTHYLLENIKENKQTLPNGPVLVFPHSSWNGLYWEIINPKAQKIKWLKRIASLFPNEYKPFKFGFGNRNTDKEAYEEVAIEKIFIVNSKGSIKEIGSDKKTTFSELGDQIFPATDQELPSLLI